MGFLKVSQNEEEFLLNTQYILRISKGKEKNEFSILMHNEMYATSYVVFGDSGLKCEKLAAVKKLAEGERK